MADLKELLSLGKQLGYDGVELQTFVKDEMMRNEQREKEKHEREREERRLAREMEKERIAGEMEKERIAGELEKERIALERARIESSGSTAQSSTAPRMTKIPIFSEKTDSIDAYLHRFEIHATSKGWKREDWAGALHLLLTGTALTVLHGMTVEDSGNYDKLKDALLKRFQMTADGYRVRFRTAQPVDTENFDSFVNRLIQLMNRWLELEGIEKGDFNKLWELVLFDQIYASCHPDLVTFIKDHSPKDLPNLREIVETYTKSRPTSKLGKAPAHLANLAGSPREPGRTQRSPFSPVRQAIRGSPPCPERRSSQNLCRL